MSLPSAEAAWRWVREQFWGPTYPLAIQPVTMPPKKAGRSSRIDYGSRDLQGLSTAQAPRRTNLNRFNVMASRARTKLVVFVTQEVVSHLANELDTLRASRLLKVYVETFCGDRRLATLPYTDATGARVEVPGMLGWH